MRITMALSDDHRAVDRPRYVVLHIVDASHMFDDRHYLNIAKPLVIADWSLYSLRSPMGV
jgi:hypothetical protein